ncbi:MAG: hypothetical protein GX552_16265 [Chloroflexi bacterium]|jgi:hypothetical protein|nr:hypothetical protein [Chloroflexota bacterium]
MPVDNLHDYLARLESLIDLEHVHQTDDLQRRAFAFEPVDHIPTIIHYPVPDDEWPAFGFLDIFDDQEKMLLHELGDVYAGAKIKDDRLFGIRANYGTGIIASMFGCRTVTFEDSLPIGLAVEPDQLARILEEGVPDLRAGLAGRALDTVAYFRETLRPYPKLSQVVGSQMLDIQGPFDNASIIWGSSIYLAFFDAPDKLRRLLQIVTDTIQQLTQRHRQVDGCPSTEHGGAWHHLGGLCVRNDSSINLSGPQYEEYVKPFDTQLLADVGGWIHFCGNAKQWWPRLLDIPGLKGLNPYQGEFYDLYSMFERCEAARVAIVQWTVPIAPRCRERIRTGFSRIYFARDFEDALRAKERLYATGHADA